MLSFFFVIAEQTLKMFLLFMIGYACGKFKIMDEISEDRLSSIVLYLTGPSIMITSFERPFSQDLFQSFFLVFSLSAVSILLSIAFSSLLYRHSAPDEQAVLRTGTVLTNCGMIGLALQGALFGSNGIFFGAAYCAAFNIAVWTYGFSMFAKGKGTVNLWKVLRNPGIIATLFGMFLFFTSLKLPELIDSPVQSIASMNTPLSMLVIGCRLSHVNFRSLIQGKLLWENSAISLLGLPLFFLSAFRIAGLHGTAPIACLIDICSPAAAAPTMFAIQFHREPNLSVRIISLQTLLSMLTIPLVVALAESILR